MNHEADVSYHHAERAPSKRQERRSQEVWRNNLEDEMMRMSDVAETYQHVAMDTQFPGIVARPTGPFSDYADYNYQTLKCNVDLTRVIQIGMTFSDAKGNRPKGISTWRFNFAFNAGRDLFAQDSIDGLRHTRGLDLAKHSSQGIDTQFFGELLMSSGLVLNEDVRWITYCGSSGFAERPPEEGCPGRPAEPPWVTFFGMYDFGHLLQLLTSQQLPDEVNGFHESLDLFFPSRCDVAKHLHRLPQLNGDGSDSRKRSFFRNAHHILEAFFRLPDAVRRTAFDRLEEPMAVPNSHRSHRKSRERDEGRHKGGAGGASTSNGSATGTTTTGSIASNCNANGATNGR
mmetsp:Transcript_83700/g.233429  ORF Transcript_83700/g.233429 Transcript_83700/m.233429 type:complete len:344 (-) Transcript_83700:190-1221(-)